MVENKSNIIPKQDHTNREVIIFDFHSAQKHKFVDDRYPMSIHEE